MKCAALMLAAAVVVLAGCSTPAIVHEQLQLNAAELLDVNEKLTSGCSHIVTTTQTPSSWWSWVAPVRQVTSSVECKHSDIFND